MPLLNTKKLLNFILVGTGLFLVLAASPLFAQAEATKCADGTAIPSQYQHQGKQADFCKTHGGIANQGNPTDPRSEADFSQEEFRCNSTKECINDNPIIKLINTVINVLSIVVGIAVTIMIVVGGIQYSSAGGDPGKVAGAKKTITSALLALLTFIFLRVIIEWVVPGGKL